MDIAYLVVTLVLAAMVAFSGLGKPRRDPRLVQIVHEVVGVPLKYFPLFAVSLQKRWGWRSESGGHPWGSLRPSA
jgi:uncharacterized membrane protein YphA (DoxX/SURF4 family)